MIWDYVYSDDSDYSWFCLLKVTMIIKRVFISYIMVVISLEVRIIAYVCCDSDYFGDCVYWELLDI